MPARARHANLQTRDPERYPARHVGERGMGWLRAGGAWPPAMTHMRIVAWGFLSVPEGDLDPVAFKSQHCLVQAEALMADFEAAGLSLLWRQVRDSRGADACQYPCDGPRL